MLYMTLSCASLDLAAPDETGPEIQYCHAVTINSVHSHQIELQIRALEHDA